MARITEWGARTTGPSGSGTMTSTVTFNVKDFGAQGDYDWKANTGTDSTAAFRAAFAAAAAMTTTLQGSAATVYVPAGNYLLEPPGGLPNRVTLKGDGPGATRLYRKASGTLTGPFITNTTNARMCTFTGFTIDGHAVGDATSHGLHLNNSAAADTDTQGATPIAEYVDARHFANDILIQSCKGSGMVVTGRGTSMVARVQSWLNDGHGFETGTDSFFTDCDSGTAGLDGFYVRGANTRLTACKAWFSGRISTTGAGVTGGTGHGFHFSDGNYSTNVLTGCEAQDNARAGYYLGNCGRHIINGSFADANNTAGLGHAGFEVINSWNCRVDGFAWDRGSNTNHQLAGYRVTGGGANVLDITVESTNMAQGIYTTDTAFGTSSNRALPSTSMQIMRPRVGEYLVTPSSGATGSAAISGTNGSVTWMPVDVAVTTTYDAIAVSVSTAGVGTGLVLRLAVYADDGTGTAPTGTALYEPPTTADPTTTGDKILLFTTPITLRPARYWLPVVLQATTVTTAPSLIVLTGPVNSVAPIQLGNVSHRSITSSSALGALTTYTAPTSFGRSGTSPLLALRRSA